MTVSEGYRRVFLTLICHAILPRYVIRQGNTACVNYDMFIHDSESACGW